MARTWEHLSILARREVSAHLIFIGNHLLSNFFQGVVICLIFWIGNFLGGRFAEFGWNYNLRKEGDFFASKYASNSAEFDDAGSLISNV